jgi:hypothetical protein
LHAPPAKAYRGKPQSAHFSEDSEVRQNTLPLVTKLPGKMAFSTNEAYAQTRQQDEQSAMNCGVGQREYLQIDPRYQSGYQADREREVFAKEEHGISPSRIGILEKEIEEVESSLDRERSETKVLREKLEQSSQQIERLMTKGQKDLNEARLEFEKCRIGFDIATQELQEKENALAQVEELLLQSKDQSRKLQEDLGRKEKDLELVRHNHLEQEKQWIYQLKEAERQRQDAAAEVVAVQGQLSLQAKVQVEGM